MAIERKVIFANDGETFLNITDAQEYEARNGINFDYGDLRCFDSDGNEMDWIEIVIENKIEEIFHVDCLTPQAFKVFNWVMEDNDSIRLENGPGHYTWDEVELDWVFTEL